MCHSAWPILLRNLNPSVTKKKHTYAYLASPLQEKKGSPGGCKVVEGGGQEKGFRVTTIDFLGLDTEREIKSNTFSMCTRSALLNPLFLVRYIGFLPKKG